MVNYKNGKIYKLICHNTGLTYVGSTTKQYLSQRLANHVSTYKRFTDGKPQTYLTAFNVLEGGNYSIELIERFPCESSDELTAREGHYIRATECVNRMMKLDPERMQEYRREKQREWITLNPEKKKAYSKADYIKNRERCLRNSRKFREKHPEYSKEWKERNKEYTKAYDAKRLEKVVCECGCSVARMHLRTHQKTKKHDKLINALETK